MNPHPHHVEDELTDLSFVNLVDIEQIRELLDAHYQITGIGVGILDTDESILVSVGWQDICTRFHRANPLSRERCRESDSFIKKHLSECKDGYLDYRCKNGLVDVAVPIIIRGEHLATFFTGQFFYDDDKPDVEYFRKQAEKFGFDEAGYLEALGRVPIFTRGHIRTIVEYYRCLVSTIAGMGLKNLELRNEVAERKQAEEALLNSRQMLMSVLENFPGVVFWKDRNSLYLGCNKNFSLAAGLSEPSEIVGKKDHELPWKNDAERYLADDRQVVESGTPKLNIIETLLHADGRVAWFETSKVPLFDEDGKVFAVLGSSNDITERKWMEDELLCSEEKYRSIVDAYDGFIYICSQDYRIEFMNRKLIERTGYSAVGELCYRVLHDRDSVCPWCVNGRVCAGETVHWEILSPKDGRWYYVVNVPIYNANGTVSKHSVIADITERKGAEETLLLSQFCIDKAGIGIYQCDHTGTIFSVNEHACKSLGYSREELCALTVFDIDPEITPERMLELKEIIDERGSATHHTTHRRRDGTTFPVEITSNHLDFQGKRYGISFVKDITERKEAEESLKRAKDEWERTFASLPDLIAILDNRHRVLRVNEAMAKRLGRKPDDYIGHPCYEAIHGLSDPHPFCPHTRTLKDGRKHLVEIHEERLGGDFQVSTTPLNDERGVMIGSVHIAYDITERKQIERMLSVKREQVAAMVVELSMAEERERLRIASVLHDHVGQTMLLGRIKLGTLAGIAKPESVERVIEEVETLLDQVIDETHSLTIQLNPPILALSSLEVALHWLGNRMESDYGLVVEFSDDMRAKPLSDELRSVLYQCTRELLINVVKHANTDHAWLRAGLEDGMFRLTVEDRGVGFNPDDIVPDLSRDNRFGIFSIQIRIERMGGRMEIESSPGSGTRIAILLPIKTTPP